MLRSVISLQLVALVESVAITRWYLSSKMLGVSKSGEEKRATFGWNSRGHCQLLYADLSHIVTVVGIA